MLRSKIIFAVVHQQLKPGILNVAVKVCKKACSVLQITPFSSEKAQLQAGKGPAVEVGRKVGKWFQCQIPSSVITAL